MSRPAAIAFMLAATLLGADASPRIAVVRVNEIYSGLESTAQLAREIQQERKAIHTDQRADDLQRAMEELQELQTQIAVRKRYSDEKGASTLEHTYELRRQKAETLKREFEGFRDKREKEINRRMVTAMRESLNRIHETARRIAAEQGYELLIDSSGNTNTGLPFILYQKEPHDLTETVKAALLEDRQGEDNAASPTLSDP